MPASRAASLPHVSGNPLSAVTPEPPPNEFLHYSHVPSASKQQLEKLPWQHQQPLLLVQECSRPGTPRSHPESSSPNTENITSVVSTIPSSSNLISTRCPSLSSLSSFAELLVTQQDTSVQQPTAAPHQYQACSQATRLGENISTSHTNIPQAENCQPHQPCNPLESTDENNGPPRPPLPARKSSLASGAITR